VPGVSRASSSLRALSAKISFCPMSGVCPVPSEAKQGSTEDIDLRVGTQWTCGRIHLVERADNIDLAAFRRGDFELNRLPGLADYQSYQTVTLPTFLSARE